MDIVERLRLVDIQFWYKPLGHGIDTDLDVPAYELGALSHEAADEIERLHDEAEHQLYKRRDAEEEIERLREALKFYADRNSYQSPSTTSFSGWHFPAPVIFDKGEKARAALKGDE